MNGSMKLATVIAVGAMALMPCRVGAEIRMEERDGVLYVRDVELSPVVAPQPASPPGERVATQTAAPYRDLIRAAAARHGLAPELVESIIRVESNFEARAVSRKGARGLMQLMPTTASQLGVRNVFDARQNVEGGVRHLRYLVDLYGGN